MKIIINKQSILVANMKYYLLFKTICFCLFTVGPMGTSSALGTIGLMVTSSTLGIAAIGFICL